MSLNCGIRSRSIMLRATVPPAEACFYQWRCRSEVDVSQMLAGNMCPYALHIALPYVTSLGHGAWFTWMRDKNAVIAQCPNVTAAIDVEIRRRSEAGRDGYSLTIVGQQDVCPRGHKTGDTFSIEPETAGTCPVLLTEIIPHYIDLCQTTSDRVVDFGCPRCGDGFQLGGKLRLAADVA